MAVLGAAGGTGLAACELGKLMGLQGDRLRVVGREAAFAKAHGAERRLNYAREDLKEGLRRLTGGKGVDIVFDPVGGSLPKRRCARSRGRAVSW